MSVCLSAGSLLQLTAPIRYPSRAATEGKHTVWEPMATVVIYEPEEEVIDLYMYLFIYFSICLFVCLPHTNIFIKIYSPQLTRLQRYISYLCISFIQLLVANKY